MIDYLTREFLILTKKIDLISDLFLLPIAYTSNIFCLKSTISPDPNVNCDYAVSDWFETFTTIQ